MKRQGLKQSRKKRFLKKQSALWLALTLGIGLAACGGADGAETETKTAGEPANITEQEEEEMAENLTMAENLDMDKNAAENLTEGKELGNGPENESGNEPAADEVVLTESYKKAAENNPIVTQRYGADPGVMVYGDTVYVYCTNDSFEYKDGEVVENTYGKIQTINCFSTKDMVNWTDHGAMPVAGQEGAAKWAVCSWAPCAAHKTIDGKEKFFLYFANNGSGVGVLVSDSPTGPWEDPVGGPLVTQGTENCAGVVWCFDPAVLVDDDGTGYLYFGGGISPGEEASPKTVRVVKLGDDMVSLAGTPQVIDAPYLFEDSCITKIDGKYYYSYCSNWSTGGTEYGAAAIEYMVGDSPMGPFTYAGEFFKNPGVYFGVWGNNHHTLFEFQGKYYLAYHARALETAQLKKSLGYRSTQIDEVTVNGGVIQELKPTMAGVPQLSYVNPYETVQAETMAIQAGILVTGVGNTIVTDISDGDWTGVKGVDFGEGASAVTLSVKAGGSGRIEIHADSPAGRLLGTAEVSDTEGAFREITAPLEQASDVLDIYFVFRGTMEFDYWQAKK